jgi:hypothetical protein
LVREEGDFPGGLVDDEEGETDYYDPTTGWPCVESP